MHYFFIPPAGTSQTVGGPVVSVQRHYTMHHRSSVKNSVSFTARPFGSLTAGVFFSRAQAVGYAEIPRAQGLSFAVEGIAAAQEALALEVERAREVGDTMAIYVSLLSLAVLSGEVGDKALAVQATVDVARVTKSAAARHRSLWRLCDCVRDILVVLAAWAGSTESVLTWDGDDDDEVVFNGDDPQNETGRPKSRNDRSRSTMDLFKSWVQTAHRLFWGWRREIIFYLDADTHSDVMVVKDRVKAWIANISNSDTMGLRLPKLRWQDKCTILDGEEKFIQSAATIEKRLASLSAWLHCLDLSLAWDAAKICDKVHCLHVEEINGAGTSSSGQRKSSKLNGNSSWAFGGGSFLRAPTSTALLELQRVWLNDTAAAVAGGRKSVEGNRRRNTDKRAAAHGARYEPAPFSPESSSAPRSVDGRSAVLKTLREDIVSEAFAHEMTLLRYATENRIDECLHEAITSLVTSALVPNPFPALADALAPASSKQLLWRAADSDEAVRALPLIAWQKQGEDTTEVDRRIHVFSKGNSRNGGVFGSRQALTGTDVDAMLNLFSTLPPVLQWVRDEPEHKIDNDGGGWNVEVGIDGSQRLPGPYTHQNVPSELTVVVTCAFGYDVKAELTPVESFANLVVHCALAAQITPSIVPIDIGLRRKPSEGNETGLIEDHENFDVYFSLSRMLHERDEVHRELVRAGPDEIVLRALTKHAIAGEGGGVALVPFAIRFVLLAEDERGSACDDTVAAALLYNCVYSTESAAKNVATRYSVLMESGLADRHSHRLSLSALRQLDRGDYLQAYRLLLLVRLMPPFASEHKREPGHSPYRNSTAAGATEPGHFGVPRTSGTVVDASDVAVEAEIARMLRGPAGRLDHAQRMLEILERLLSLAKLPTELIPLAMEVTIVQKHAEYTVQYLLDSVNEQPPVRFEGGVESMKLRARLMLDRVREMGGRKIKTEGDSHSAYGSDCAEIGEGYKRRVRERACSLARQVLSLLEIVQLAIRADVHRCCPEVKRVFDELGAEMAHQKRMQTVNGVAGTAGEPESKRPSFNSAAGKDVDKRTIEGGKRRHAVATILPTSLLPVSGGVGAKKEGRAEAGDIRRRRQISCSRSNLTEIASAYLEKRNCL